MTGALLIYCAGCFLALQPHMDSVAERIRRGLPDLRQQPSDGGGADGGAADVFWRFSRTVCAGPHSDRVRVLQGSSTHALAGLLVEQQGGEDDVEGGRGGGGRASFDFIYIDGGHDGPQVSLDIAPPRGSFLRQLKLSLSFFVFHFSRCCRMRCSPWSY